jgi:hypothetical protein
MNTKPTTTMILTLSARGVPTLRVPVASFAEASRRWAQFRDAEGFGASGLKRDSGRLTDSKTGTLVAHVSYNGRVWGPDPTSRVLLEEAQ